MDNFGRIDSVVASAGIVENYSAFDYPFDRIKRLYDINVHGAFFTAREAARNMIPQGGGSITLVASMSASVVNIPQVRVSLIKGGEIKKLTLDPFSEIAANTLQCFESCCSTYGF